MLALPCVETFCLHLDAFSFLLSAVRHASETIMSRVRASEDVYTDRPCDSSGETDAIPEPGSPSCCAKPCHAARLTNLHLPLYLGWQWNCILCCVLRTCGGLQFWLRVRPSLGEVSMLHQTPSSKRLSQNLRSKAVLTQVVHALKSIARRSCTEKAKPPLCVCPSPNYSPQSPKPRTLVTLRNASLQISKAARKRAITSALGTLLLASLTWSTSS